MLTEGFVLDHAGAAEKAGTRRWPCCARSSRSTTGYGAASLPTAGGTSRPGGASRNERPTGAPACRGRSGSGPPAEREAAFCRGAARGHCVGFARSAANSSRARSVRLRYDWPRRPLLIPAVDAESGEPVVWDAAAGVPLVRAVAASSAVPGVEPPVAVKGRRYVDGALRAGTTPTWRVMPPLWW
ncbi:MULTISPECIES: patatin-like phospholipase family protein [unclassified Streptomyces]|uniref:patatin-like phospholipase family protein n=1 Tax=unclassified Streptomyces TaxID=2593676 RepID=UPI003701F322